MIQSTLALKATSPVDKQDQGRASFAGLSGLPGGLTLGGDWTWVRMNNPVRGDAGRAMRNACTKLGMETDPGHCTQGKLKQTVDARGADAKDVWDEFIGIAVGWTQLLNTHVNVGHTQYKYFNATPTEKVTDSKINWSIGGLGGVITPDYTTFIGAGFDFVHSYKEASDTAECLVGTTPYLACTVGKFSAPTDQVHRVVSLQARHLTPVGKWQLPIGLTLAHDLATTKGRQENSVDMPVYFLRDKDGWFDGGFRLGWSTTDHFIAGIFVGSRFDLDGITSK